MASTAVVKSNVAKMKEMFKNLGKTKREKKELYPDFTGCADKAIKAPQSYAHPTPMRSSDSPTKSPQAREKMRQQVAQALHLFRNGLSMEEARQQVGL